MSAQSPQTIAENNKQTQRADECHSRRVSKLASFLALTFFALPMACAQLTPTQNGPQNGRRVPQVPQIGISPAVGPNGTFQARRIRELNVERQKEMVSDTDDLLKLTKELNAEVAKNHSSLLTPDQVRKLARIEKLAKSIREKMSNPVQGSIFENNFPPPMGPAAIP